MQRACSAKGQQREGARIVAALDGDAAKSALHAGVADAEDAFGEVLGAVEPAECNAIQRLMSTGLIEAHGSA